jgi:hypothetical protein
LAQQNHWTERGRAASISTSGATARPRRSVLAFDNTMKTHAFILLGALAFASTLQAATVSLFADGTIDQAWSGAYPFVDAGDSFRLSVSYSEGWADTDPSASLGVYLPEDLSITLDILGEGTAFHSLGGSVNVTTEPGEFPAIGILSTLADGNALFFVFRKGVNP